MGKLSRDKGKRGELEVVKLLQDHGFEARRGQQHRGGSDSPDVIHNMKKMGPAGWSLHVEVKRREAFNLYDALAKAEAEAPDETSVVFHRKNDKQWLVTLSAREFLDMMYCLANHDDI